MKYEIRHFDSAKIGGAKNTAWDLADHVAFIDATDASIGQIIKMMVVYAHRIDDQLPSTFWANARAYITRYRRDGEDVLLARPAE